MHGKAGIVTLMVVLPVACTGDEAGWTPVLEGTPPTFLDGARARALVMAAVMAPW